MKLAFPLLALADVPGHTKSTLHHEQCQVTENTDLNTDSAVALFDTANSHRIESVGVRKM